MDFFFHLVRALVQKIQTVNKVLCSIADKGKWRQIQSVISKYVAYDNDIPLSCGSGKSRTVA